MKRKAHIILLVLLLLCVLSTTAFAIDESEVESAIAASSKEEVAGNVFIWFLCAIGFLKVSQKIDSFMASLGINVGRTGGSMLTELMVAGRGIAAVAGAVGGTVFNHHSSSSKMPRIRRKEDLPDVMTMPLVAKTLGCSLTVAYRLLKRDDFPHTVSGQRVYIDKGKFLSWLDAQTQMEKGDHYGW